MTTKTIHKLSIFFLLLIFFAFGCTSIAKLQDSLGGFQGGTVVDGNYQPKKILVTYRIKGDSSEKVKYYLIETPGGKDAIWEKASDAGSIFEAYRETEKGDHFSAWVVGNKGFEFIIPKDRTKNAERYVYGVGTYEAQSGSMAVIPLENIPPKDILIPE